MRYNDINPRVFEVQTYPWGYKSKEKIMRLYGVFATLGIVSVAFTNTQPAFAETSTDRSLHLASQGATISTINKTGDSVLNEHQKAVITVKSDKTNTKAKIDDQSKKEDSTPKTPVSTDQNEYVVVADGDSLSSIASAHNTTWDRIYDANESLTNPNVITAGEKLRIPKASEQLPNRAEQYEASVAQQQAQAASTTNASNSYSSSAGRTVSGSSHYTGNGMWCTDYVHSRRPDIPIYGNAGYNWISSANAAGKSTGTTPRAGAVAVMPGHVAYVESVNADGTYVVSEMGWNYQAGNYNIRTVSPGAFGAFIY